MKDFLQNHGTEFLFSICGTFAASVLFVCITISTMDSNKNYYASMNKCIEAEGTWIPNRNVGICLVRGSVFND
jgi:hypothetical protein